MTRLTTDDVAGLAKELPAYDRELIEKTGLSLLGLAARAAGLDEASARARIAGTKVGVIPMTCGQGVIPGFTLAVAEIAAHLGFDAFVTHETDAGGMAEAVLRGADLLTAADDRRYFAINLKTRLAIDNDEATGAGFACALDRMAGGLEGRRVLVIGLGPVGRNAAQYLIRFKAGVHVHDLDRERVEAWLDRVQVPPGLEPTVVEDLSEGLAGISFVLDATPAADLIDERFFKGPARAAAPGVPCGVAPSARKKHAGRIVHDPLQIGTAVMLVMALAPNQDRTAIHP